MTNDLKTSCMNFYDSYFGPLANTPENNAARKEFSQLLYDFVRLWQNTATNTDRAEALDAMPDMEYARFETDGACAGWVYKYHKTIRAALQTPAVPDGWQPIETAPRDGTEVIVALYSGHPKHSTSFCWAINAYYNCDKQGWFSKDAIIGRLIDPTHWMPLSAAPHPQESEEE